jgi:hypothetical protein
MDNPARVPSLETFLHDFSTRAVSTSSMLSDSMLWTTEQDVYHLNEDLKVFSDVAMKNNLVPELMAVWNGADTATR